MREIKFRAWHKVAPKADWAMTYWALGTGLDRSVFYDAAINNDGSVMQFTGLKDKNGKEIYEGDIIKFDDKNIGFINCADWLEFFVDWIGKPDCTDYARDFYRIGRAEVIGNVHENPELL